MQIHATYDDLFEFMRSERRLDAWLPNLQQLLKSKLQDKPHGDLDRWLSSVEALPNIKAESIQLDSSRVGAQSNTISQQDKHALEAALQGLSPWRKGPFDLFGVHIDTEWRSDWKWERVREHISPLKNRTILDVGCGSGYHCWRMLGEGAHRVIGVDPSYLFLMQFLALKKYCLPQGNIHLLPIKIEDVAPNLEAFDTTFSMGVLYHRRSPIDHLLELKGTLRKGGELVLETLIIDGELGVSLVPEDRYAMMRNVWFIPSIPTLELWLRRAGFENVRCVEDNVTSIEEQRRSDWMQYQSLQDFLDPQDHSKTAEGYPAPRRATFIAQKPF
jgi:tRNA (mo5U34)-methyltransferase